MSVQAPVASRTRLQRISRVFNGFRLDERVFDEEDCIMEELDERRWNRWMTVCVEAGYCVPQRAAASWL